MDIFKITNFSAAIDNPSPQVSGVGSTITEFNDRVELKIGSAPTNGSTYSREKYRLATNYVAGDDFWIWETFELPSDYYSNHTASMRLIGLWHNTNRGRLGLWIDSTQAPRLQIEDKSGVLRILWRGAPRQFPTGKHKLALHVVLGTSGSISLVIDGVTMGSYSGNVMPYAGYSANQILFGFDGANGNTKVCTATMWEIGASTISPFAVADPCASQQAVYDAAVKKTDEAEALVISIQATLTSAQNALLVAQTNEQTALNSLSVCRLANP